jgi:hypothetical protein
VKIIHTCFEKAARTFDIASTILRVAGALNPTADGRLGGPKAEVHPDAREEREEFGYLETQLSILEVDVTMTEVNVTRAR